MVNKNFTSLAILEQKKISFLSKFKKRRNIRKFYFEFCCIKITKIRSFLFVGRGGMSC